ncbi:hypothetical protein ART_0394 [Arthrobacter sp. PAMC 25486]|uniref:cyclophilin-like fold protein n=1 Tax=Arthrobacter sp. PAMC 25486 TaxID=1494608 RepID=UPI0005362E27|nr:cyclophilin-like fold protein [Arthrobacter sp. PAMC 25486]AIX99992.1 hypothetical protein ART_0394 [Arthrobacter sp. PAMC 25486]
MRGKLFLAAPLAALVALAGCTTPTRAESGPTRAETGTGTLPPQIQGATTASDTAPAPAAATPEPAVSPDEDVLVRFTAGETTVDVTITPDNPTAKDFLILLPLTVPVPVPVEEFAGMEKLAHLPRDLETAGSPGSGPENGFLIYYIPWGNLGFHYTTDGIGYSDQIIHLGIYNATTEPPTQLEGDNITVHIVK